MKATHGKTLSTISGIEVKVFSSIKPLIGKFWFEYAA